MSVTFLLERVSDGAQRWCSHSVRYEPELAIFQWVENNYSCDCNRELFWCESEGIDPPEDPACGFESRYRLLSLRVDGAEVWP